MGMRHGVEVMDWFPMAKGVAHLHRYAEVSLAANRRYLNALAVVSTPAPAYHALEQFARSVHDNGRSNRGFNPVAREDLHVFRAVLRGEHAICGFRNRDLRQRLYPTGGKATDAQKSARTSRTLKRLHSHGLIAKVPRTRRWRVTDAGHLLMSTAIRLRDEYFGDAVGPSE